MASIEKVCEYSGEYPSWKMYGYKRNHIQIMPKYRKKFRGLKATLTIKKTGLDYHVAKLWITEVNDLELSERRPNRIRGDYEKTSGRWYVWKTDNRKTDWIIAVPVRVLPEYEYVLDVPGCEGDTTRYINWTFQPTDVIRRMKRLVGTKNLTVVRK